MTALAAGIVVVSVLAFLTGVAFGRALGRRQALEDAALTLDAAAQRELDLGNGERFVALARGADLVRFLPDAYPESPRARGPAEQEAFMRYRSGRGS